MTFEEELATLKASPDPIAAIRARLDARQAETQQETTALVAALREIERAAGKPAEQCPRRGEPGPWLAGAGADDYWRSDGTCSYCGSLAPDVLMDRIEAGTVQLGPTDKNYKAYVKNDGGADLGFAKFYFPHFSAEQCRRFVELYNAKRIKFGAPGAFYVLPYFMRRTEAA